MKTEILVALLFVAAASASSDVGASDDGKGMCPITYLKKHPDAWEKKKELTEKYGYPDFSKLKSCSSDEICDKGMKCCQTPCGMKCMKAVFEDNALETIEQIHKEIATGVDDKPYEITEEDKKYGMCPNNYIKVHPEVKEKMDKRWKHKHSKCKGGEKCSHKHSPECKDGEQCHHKHSHECKDGEQCHHKHSPECKDGEQCSHKHSHECKGGKQCSHKHSHECKGGKQCSHKHSHHKKHGHFRNFTALADCSVDGDCSNNTRCCSTMCGKKCIKPVFTNTDLEESLFGKKEDKDNRGKRNVENDDESDMDHDNEMEHGKGHGKGKRGKGKRGKGHKKGGGHRKGQCKGGDHGNCNGQCNGEEEENGNKHGKGGRHGKGHGEGEKHGKGHGEGAKHGKGHGKGKGKGKGKGHGKGLEHGKGHKKAQEHEAQDEEEGFQFRQKRSTNSVSQSKNSNNHDNGVKHHNAN